VRFWDASAVVPLLIHQEASIRMEAEFAADPAVGVWCLTAVEAWSGVCRSRHESRIDSPGMRAARKRLQELTGSWIEVDDVRAVRLRAQRLLETHSLRAGDALQLAAPLVLVSDVPQRIPFVTLDARLAEAAEKEGFEVYGVAP
jgi:uncharacterized protein